ncbi:MAG: helix-turn-helix domain-containing protein [Myxococcota bacterium]
MAKQADPICEAFEVAIDVLGRPWTGLILGLLQNGPLRFNELREGGRGVGDKVLSARLKELEARGLVIREVDAGPPVKVLYSLTPKGQAFGRVKDAIERWGRELMAEEKPRARKGRQSD